MAQHSLGYLAVLVAKLGQVFLSIVNIIFDLISRKFTTPFCHLGYLSH